MSDLGKRLQNLREAHGLSQRALAKRSGISNALISLIEKDKISPSITSLKKILDSFPIELSEFFSMKYQLVENNHNIITNRRQNRQNVL